MEIVLKAKVGQGEVSPASVCCLSCHNLASITGLFHGLVAVDKFPYKLASSGFHGGLLIVYEKCQVTGH